MNPYYYDERPSSFDDEFLMTFLGIILIVMAVVLVVALIFWIIRSISLHRLAKRRGIRNAWLVWLPVGAEWVLGSVADQYQHLVQGKVTSRRKVLLILGAVGLALGLVNGAYTLVEETARYTDAALAVDLLAVLISAVGLGINITRLVFCHICNYDLYRSCNPKNAVAFLVLGIIFPVCEPFFYLSCRNKDLGMVVPEPAAPAAPVELPKANPEF